ncbi:hypothetical protein SPRG_13624 [Saprolegnia parasitica CBS 223.65]|uniref:Uncharacterized protein n=1 Tax=Saprolegnia parasitica (strain CBS 223.65) TaxID=695850 RepID=A0A067BRD0_SAPPC|nr:hypothetical protein SPRG_13624 [Saprolegnia parasitica CBS 223.65]KDO20808.1 hypothetical protein SPRG_13624 [Saprolegnia parasitica CBS 223.65]|eukprot:XP_012208467.1 hypothetical protein SPRG_13624 [Saprolegnia parasitica CBS 223.65]
MATGLSPDLVQLIVMYMVAEAGVASLLLALPPALLTASFAALQTLFRALFAGDFVDELFADDFVDATRSRSMHLSTLVLPETFDIYDKPILLAAFQAASCLYASLTTDTSSRVPWDLPPHVAIELPRRIAQARHVFSRLAPWHTRISLLSVEVSSVHCHWTRSDLEKLATLLPTLPRLRSLHLSCEGPYAFEMGLVLTALFTLRSLTHLSLTTNVWSEAISRVFAEWLTTAPVSSLRLRGRFPMQSQVQIVVRAIRSYRTLRAPSPVRAIRSCRTLRSLALDDTALVRAFVAAPLPAHLCELELGIDRPTAVDEPVDKISNAVALHLHLEALGVRLGLYSRPLDILPLVQCLPTLRRLRRLDLTNLELRPMARDALWTVLPRLTELRLEKSHLGDDGVAEIAAVLPACYRLRRLSLIRQGISDVGALILARSLPLCPSLADVDLTDNVIANDGAMAFWPLLPRLTMLSLRRNRIGNDAAMALSEVLRITAHMRSLDLSENNVGLPALRAIFTALRDDSFRASVINVSVTSSDYDVARSFALSCLRDPYRVGITRLR